MRTSKLVLATFAAALLFFVIQAPVAWSGEGQPVPAAKKWSPLPHLPADSLVVVSLKNARRSYERLQQTALWKLYYNEGVQRAFKAPLLMARGGMVKAEMQLKVKLSDLLDVFQGEVTFAFMGFLEEKNEKGEPIPDLLLAFQPEGKAEAWTGIWNGFVDRMNKATDNTLVMEQQAFAGTDVVALSHPGIPFQINYANADGVFLVAMGPGRIEKMLAAREAAKAAKTKPDIKVDVKTLANSAAFKRAQAKGGAHGEVVVYLNIERMKATQSLRFHPKNEREKKLWDLSGLTGIKSVSYHLGLKGAGMRETLYIDTPEKDRTGMLKLLGGAALSPELLAQAPRNAVAATVIQMDPQQMLDRILDVGGIMDPNLKAQTNALIDQMGKDLGIDVRKDVLGAFTGQASITLAMPAKHPKLPVGFPQPVLTLKVKDATTAQKAMNALRRVGRDKFEFFEVTHKGSDIVVMREKFPERKRPSQLSWVLVKDRMIVSLYPLALRDEIDRMAAGAKAGGSLADDSDFKAASAHLTKGQQALFYMDTGALATAAYDILIPILQLNPKDAKRVDIYALPSASVLTRNLEGMAAGVATDANGITIDSYSTTGLASAALPMGGMVAEMIKKRRRRAGGQAQVAAAADNLDPELVKRRQMLREINKRLRGYAKDNKGELPVQLTDMIPNYVEEKFREVLGKITYLGRQENPKRVVAYFGSGAVKGNQVIPILLQNGAVEVVQGRQLTQVLQNGFAGGGQKPGAKAIKPPAPPPDF